MSAGTVAGNADIERGRMRLLGAAALAFPIILVQQGIVSVPYGPWVQLALATVLQFTFGLRFYRGAARWLRGGADGTDLLVATGITALWSCGVLALLLPSRFGGGPIFFDASALLILFILFGRSVEARAAARAVMVVEETLSPGMVRMAKDARPDGAPLPAPKIRLCRRMTPLILFLAIVVFFVWSRAADRSLSFSLTRAAAVLVAASPCAFLVGISPTKRVALSIGLKRGVLFRRGSVLQSIASVRTILFERKAVADGQEAKEGATNAVARIEVTGVRTALVTGDGREEAEEMCRFIGLGAVYPETSPEKMTVVVARLSDEAGPVAMVGESVEDAAAIEAADVGIVFGTGPDTGDRTGDIIIVGSDPRDVSFALELGRAADRKMTQNFLWAIAYNIVAVSVAAGLLSRWGIVPPVEVFGLVSAFVSVLIVMNSLDLKRWRPVDSWTGRTPTLG